MYYSFYPLPEHVLQNLFIYLLIGSKLYTQANKTQHSEINHSHLCQIEPLLSKPKLCYQNLTILCQNVTLMTKWCTHLHHMNTLLDQQQNTLLHYTVFIQFHRRHFHNNQNNLILNTVHCSTVLYNTVNSVKAKIKLKIHRKTWQLWNGLD